MPSVNDEAGAAGIAQQTKTWGAALGDFDGNGWTDFLLSRHGDRPAQLWLNHPDHVFTLGSTTFPVVDRHDCVAADFSLDGRLDAFCSTGATEGTAAKANELWVQQTSGTLLNQVNTSGLIDVYGRGRHAAVIDANDDGMPDLFVGNSPVRLDGVPSPDRLFLNLGGSRFRDAPDFGLTQEIGSSCAHAADYDADGFEDLLLCPEGEDTLRLYHNVGGTRFTDVSEAAGIGGDVQGADFVDANGDGVLDIVAAELTEVRVYVQGKDAEGQPSGRFTRAWSTPSALVTSGADVAAGDANGDGLPDLYVVQDGSPNVHDVMLLNSTTAPDAVSFTNMSDVDGGAFEATQTSAGVGDQVYAFDYDHNGCDDFLVLNGSRSDGPIQLIAFCGSAGRSGETAAAASRRSTGAAPATGGPGGTRAATACPPTWTATTAQIPNSRSDLLAGVDGVAGTDVWAVGTYGLNGFVRTLAQHWDGSSWTVATTPNPGNNGNNLNAVSMASGSDAWAVGSSSRGGSLAPLALHYDGSTWTSVAVPNLHAEGMLIGVSARSPAEAWAVGYTMQPSGHQPLVLRWDGSKWSRSPLPALPGDTFGDTALTDVVAVAAGDAWAVGYRGTLDGYRTLAYHWDGAAWSPAAPPNTGTPATGAGDNVLLAVDADGDGGIVASGYAYSTSRGGYETLLLRSGGSAWSTDPTIDVGPETTFRGVSAASPDDAWAVGTAYDPSISRYRALAEHWDGTGWSLTQAQNVAGDNELLSTAALAADDWAAGTGALGSLLMEHVCPVRVLDNGFVPTATTVELGSTVVWKVPSNDSGDHSVTDGTGMGLFDSGARPPGASFAFTFPGAGVYTVLDTVPAPDATSKIKVPVQASPSSGGTSTHFTITLGTTPLPSGFVFDAQVKLPGTTRWVTLGSASAALTRDYVPTAGKGTYQFRARVRRTAGGASGYSPTASITVS